MKKGSLLLTGFLLLIFIYESTGMSCFRPVSCEICFQVVNKDSIPIKNAIIEVLNTSGITEKYLTNGQGEVCNVLIDDSLKYAFVFNKDGYFQQRIMTETPCDSKRVVVFMKSNLISH
jgi:hypothetical protein